MKKEIQALLRRIFGPLFFVAILFAETLMDYATRGWLNYTPMGQ